jgi:hypothetical protein
VKKTIKSKLRLNSQTIRTLKEVRGGRVQYVDMPQLPDDGTSDLCTMNCTAGCRGCG